MERTGKVSDMTGIIAALCLSLNSLKSLQDRTSHIPLQMLLKTHDEIRIQIDTILRAPNFRAMLEETRKTHAFVLNTSILFGLLPPEIQPAQEIVRVLKEISGALTQLEDRIGLNLDHFFS